MLNCFKVALYITAFGILSSGIGGFIGGAFNINRKGVIAFLYEITSGIMTGIVCFEMLPESFEIASIYISIIGIIIGVAVIYSLDILIKRFNKSKSESKIISLIIMISMSFHNAIEGLAIGASFVFSFSLGITILISIFLHDIPEGMIVGITSKIDEKSNIKAILNSCISGAFVGIGGFIGNYIGNISNYYISLSISIAAGAMLYIVACNLIPEANINKKNKLIDMTYILGIVLGWILSKI